MPPSNNENLLHKIERNDPTTTWFTLSRNHVSMDICHLLAALAGNTSIQKISFHAPFVANLSSASLTRLLEASVALPRLEELWLGLPANRSHLSALVLDTVLGKQAHIGSLKKLSLKGVDEQGCFAVARTLAVSNSLLLEDLNLQGECSTKAGLEIVKALETNTSLQKLVLPGVVVDNSCCRALAQVLRVNTTLTKLDLVGVNGTRQYLELNKDYAKACQEVVDVFAKSENTTLQYLTMGTSPCLQAALAFYTQLNRAGISSLLKRPSLSWEEFETVVERFPRDVSILFHVLLEAPQWATSGFGQGTKPVFGGTKQLSNRKKPTQLSLPESARSYTPRILMDKRQRRCSEPAIQLCSLNLVPLDESDIVNEKQSVELSPTEEAVVYGNEEPYTHPSNAPSSSKKTVLPPPDAAPVQAKDLPSPLPPKVWAQKELKKECTAVPQEKAASENRAPPQWNERIPFCPKLQAPHGLSRLLRSDSTIHSSAAYLAVPLERQTQIPETTHVAGSKRSSQVWQIANVFETRFHAPVRMAE